MPRLSRRGALARLLALPTAMLPAAAQAQTQGVSFTADRLVTGPLEPVAVAVRAPGYTGPASVLLFDARKRYAGTAEGRVDNGEGIVNVLPRGALGPQWAALFLSGQQAAVNPVLFTLDARTTIRTGRERFDAFVPAAEKLLAQSVLTYALDGGKVRGYRSPDSALIWLRDHVYQLHGFRHFDGDVRGALDAFRGYQQGDGSFPDFLPRPEFQIAAARTPVEADVEYLYVQGVYEAWQASGDDNWLRTHLGSMRRALEYTLRNPLRWDAARGLVKRPYTIDTWDFEVGPTTTDPVTGNPAPRHWIDERTIWGIFHGDNTGLAQALTMMGRVEERAGDPNLAQFWRDLANGIMRNINALSWNGSFYRHHVPFQPVNLPGVDHERQLSLSNAIALNRGVLNVEQGQAILAEYIRRAEVERTSTAPGAFAEWFSIDPPFPPGTVGLAGRSGEIPGSYVNGGIMPLVGGELARGAFRYGHEEYGLAILEHYWQRMLSRGRSFLWYHRDGAEGVGSDDTIPSDGWGTAAMLSAMLEGVAGIEDRGIAYRDVVISTRWNATPDVRDAYAATRYAAGDGYVAYRWQYGENVIDVQVSSSADRTRLRILLPPGVGEGRRSRITATLNGGPIPFQIEQLINSRYLLVDAGDTTVVNVQVRW